MDIVEHRKLAAGQVEAFYHEDFVDGQVRDFGTLMPDAGYIIVGTVIGTPEPVSSPLRVLLFKTIRRDS